MSKQKMKINLSYNELVKLIESYGWSVERNNKHTIYSHPNNPNKIVVSHKKAPGALVVRKIRNTLENTYYGQNARFTHVSYNQSY